MSAVAPAQALRLGAFVLGGLALLVLAIVSLVGGHLLAPTEPAVLRFQGSVYGLQPGAPVVLRGVRVGSVRSIGLQTDAQGRAFEIPVRVQIDRSQIRLADGQPGPGVAALVAQGLVARLSQQSLLTGLLYVDLDLRPGAARPPAPAGAAGAAGLPEIPTEPSAWQTLQAQLQGLDLGQLVRDVSATAAAARTLLADPQLRQTVQQLAQASHALQQLLALAQQRAGPLDRQLQATLADVRTASQRLAGALERTGAAADRVGGAAERVGAAAGRVEASLAPDAPLPGAVLGAAEALGRGAQALQQLGQQAAPPAQTLQQTLQEVGRAARALTELAELLERQPDALLRGRRAAP